MNVILQAFVHNPLLQTHFLSNPHDSRACSREACIACEMDGLFQQVFSGNHTPYGPTTFLRSIWQASTELSGYSQKDAHEFFITALNQIHAGFSKNERTLDCACVVHQTFAGELQSTVTCLTCKRKTVANDPMLDISLDLRPLPKRGREHDQLSQVPHSLLECLQRFTTAETLDTKEYSCSHCGSECKEATKQLLIKSLPPVLSFQLKRFEHSASASKIESLIRIPLELDMTPFTTQSQSTHPAHSLNAFDEQAVVPNPACHYRLFAVINHEGSLETGHYTMYALHRKEWFRFDDDLVTVARLGDILKNKAYMCFYVRSFLDYSPA
ncbi:hypothetical protein H4R35_006468 [Dimargaris xerosporica]|nr:hypothetical protein H4R35_006468 [Dimargaris xerosporica]